jgi:type I restriction-modification system DNA methylase subunit
MNQPEHSLQIWHERAYEKKQTATFDTTTKQEFQTPPDIAAYMVSLLPSKRMKVLEPTPGVGNVAKALRKAGHRVTTPKDYFLLKKRRKFEAIVMNPPFSSRFVDLTNAPIDTHKAGMKMGYWFLTDCMKRAPIVIALMPWFVITDSDVRMRMFTRWGLKSVTTLPRRTFKFARIQTIVLYLEKGYKGPIQMIPFECRDDNSKMTLFESNGSRNKK